VRRPGRASERGSASVLALPLLGALAVTTVLLGLVAGAVVAQRQAAAAADLAALAGAAALQAGGDGCAEAAAVTVRNGAEVVSCLVAGAELRVTVRAETAALFGRSLTVSARARAGPA
jgi:secretion/DNA translocation related TadE-like protein